GTSTGNYIYLEASNGCDFQTANLLSPCINLNGTVTPELELAYHMFGSDMGELHVDINANGVWTNDVVSPIVGNKGNAWYTLNVPLSSYVNQTVYFRIRGITGSGYQSDLAIDDINIFDSTPLQFDGMVSDFLSNNNVTSCDNPVNYPVEIEIKNNGVSTMSNFTASYQLDNNPVVTETVNASISSGNTSNFAFTNTINISALGSYDLKVWINYSNDLNAFNDTIHEVLNVSNTGVLSIPHTLNVEGLSNCGTASDCAAEVCNTGTEWMNLDNGVDDDIDWRVNQGATPSQNTGPSVDYVPGTSSGKYLYLEASGTCDNQEAQLVSNCIDLTSVTSPSFSFAYHMLGTNMGELHLDIKIAGTWINDIISPITGNQGNSWQVQTVNLNTYAGNMVNFRFRGITGTGFESDIAIDDMKFTGVSTAPPTANHTTQGISCAGGSTTILDASTGSPTAWSWDFGSNATPTTATGQGPHNVSFSTSGAHPVQLIASNVNGSDTIIKTVQVDTIPEPYFGTLIYTNSITFTNQTTGGGTQSYSWDFGDGNTSTLQSPTHSYASTGNYLVQLTVTNGCGTGTYKDSVSFIVGINEDFVERVIKLYPNPTKDRLILESNSSDLDISEYWITSLQGQRLLHKMIGVRDIELIDVSDFAQGVYFMSFKIEDNVFQKRFEVLR
ncbi:MAG: PKD domain-containing protein, partial [Flavobacteriales bacterium]|nr:PKD domain-containing protein [Flavobacteriales bacterium]